MSRRQPLFQLLVLIRLSQTRRKCPKCVVNPVALCFIQVGKMPMRDVPSCPYIFDVPDNVLMIKNKSLTFTVLVQTLRILQIWAA